MPKETNLFEIPVEDYEIEDGESEEVEESSGFGESVSEEPEEVIDITPPKKTQKKEGGAAMVKAADTTVAKHDSVADLLASLDEGVDSNIEGAIVGEIGIKVSLNPIEKMKFTQAKKERMALLSRKVVIYKYHYNEELKLRFMCFNGECCAHEDYPKLVYTFPAVLYDTDNKGKIISTKLELRMIGVSRDVYNKLKEIDENTDDGITSVDLVFSTPGDKEEKYQSPNVTPAGKAAFHRSIEMVKAMVEQWESLKEHAYKPFGQKLTPAEYADRLSRGGISCGGDEDGASQFADSPSGGGSFGNLDGDDFDGALIDD
jgi:hypothetical protein